MILNFRGNFEDDKKIINDYHDEISKNIDDITRSFDEIKMIWKDVNDSKVELFKDNACEEMQKLKDLNRKNVIKKEEQYRLMDGIMSRING